LPGPFDFSSQLGSGIQNPVGVSQKLTTDQDHIGFAFFEDVFSLLCFGDHTDSTGGDFGFLFDAL
jgi:hypothetical protein